MTLDELLEQFDEVLDSGIKIPGKKTVVDVEKLRAVVDDIRLNIPAEIKQAKGIVADRAYIITNAKREADGIIRNAEDNAADIVSKAINPNNPVDILKGINISGICVVSAIMKSDNPKKEAEKLFKKIFEETQENIDNINEFALEVARNFNEAETKEKLLKLMLDNGKS